jgi:hypothetical protein
MPVKVGAAVDRLYFAILYPQHLPPNCPLHKSGADGFIRSIRQAIGLEHNDSRTGRPLFVKAVMVAPSPLDFETLL